MSEEKPIPPPPPPPLEEGDYYIDESGLMVLTAQYLLKRGFCCENGCRHCRYGHSRPS